MRVIFYTSSGLLVLSILLTIYPSFIHNQYFSNVASLDRSIELNQDCGRVYSQLEQYRLSSPVNVFLAELDISATPERRHKVDVASTLVLNDLSTPFNTISYYVFCSTKHRVVGTLLSGD
jgi:hypothetical protein